jgi:hypothetical protein
MTAPKPVSAGIKLLVRKAPAAAAATAAVGRLSLDEKKAAAPAKGPSELFAELLEVSGGDVGAAAARIKELLAAGSRDAAALGGLALREGVPALHTYGLMQALQRAVGEDALPVEREAGLVAYAALAREGGRLAEPFLLPMLPAVLACHADKVKAVREAAAAAGAALIAALNPHAAKAATGLLLAGTEQGLKWQARAGALVLLGQLAKRAPAEFAHCMVAVVPRVSECMVDIRQEVAAAATEAMLAACATTGNRDLEPHIPALTSCIARPAEVPDVIAKLSATTFVQAMEDGTLAVMVPLMVRALRERSTVVNRRASVIIENMCKLVGGCWWVVWFNKRVSRTGWNQLCIAVPSASKTCASWWVLVGSGFCHDCNSLTYGLASVIIENMCKLVSGCCLLACAAINPTNGCL